MSSNPISKSDTYQTIADRLDRLPSNRFIHRTVALLGLVYLMEAFDVGLLGVTLGPIVDTFHLNAGQRGELASAANLGIVIGVVVSGITADRFGRKRTLITGMVGYSILSLVTIVSPNITVLVMIRIIAGVGMGMTFPLPYAIAGELVRFNRRSASSGLMDALGSVGYFIAPLLGFFLVPHLATALSWKVAFAIGVLPAFYAMLLIKYIPESPRWLAAHGRLPQALAIVQHIEDAVRREIHEPLPELHDALRPESPTSRNAPNAPPSSLTWHSWHYVLVTAVSSLAFSGTLIIFELASIYMPTILHGYGLAVGSSFLFAALIQAGPVPGKILCGILGESWGRRSALALFMGLAGIGALLFGIIGHSAVTLIIYGILLSTFGSGVFGTLKMYWAEQYPTSARTTGSGIVEFIGRLVGGVIAVELISAVLDTSGPQPVFIGTGVLVLLGATAVVFFGKETAARSLEQIHEESTGHLG